MKATRYCKHHLFLALIVGALLFALAGCEKGLGLKSPKTSHTAVFDELWKVMDERYALFSLKGIDWKNSYQQFRLQVNDEMPDHDFFGVLSNMLDSLKDGHISLISAQDSFTYDKFYKLYPANFNYNNLLNNYLHNDYESSGPLMFKIVDSIGYIYYSSFQNDITDAALDQVMNEMNNTKGLMIDVRNNTGGNSANVDKLFSRFINQKKLVKYEKIKKGSGHDDFFTPEAHYVDPTGTFYNKPIALLTNRLCYSSCNDFVSYMNELSNVKIFGDQTGGGGSIPYDYILANGWKLQYSATMTISPGNTPIEGGIAPDEWINITPILEGQGLDPIVDAAFLYLQ